MAEQSGSASVRVVVVSYETREELRTCLRALDPGHRPGLEVVVVDNASRDDSAAMVREEFPAVRLEASATNVGFAGGVNRGLAGSTADFALVLNPDVELTPAALEDLVRFLSRTPEAAAASPLLVDADGRPQEHLYRRFPTTPQIVLFWTVLSVVIRRIAPLRRRLMEHALSGRREPVAVDQLPGAAILIRGKDLRDIGPFDPDYFIWWEDVDWCYRARRAGRRLYVLPDVKARHAGAASFRGWSTETRVFQFYRAFFRFLCKHRLDRLRRRVTPVLLADLRLKGALLAARRRLGRGRPDARTSLRPARRAIRDVVARCARGRLPAFRDAAPPGSAPPHVEAGAPARAQRSGRAAAHVDVVVVNWNGARYLPECLRALTSSSPAPRIIVVDNASTDGSADLVAREAPGATLLAMDRNVGYAAGANAGIAAGSGDYIRVINPDVRLAPGHLERLLAAMDSTPTVGLAQGRLLGIGPDDYVAGREPADARLDSAGIVLRRTRMAYDRGQGEPDGPAWGRSASVFGACGAALLVRRSAAEDLAPDGRLFDPAFFAYKEDVDLGWRARLFGWDVRYVPDAVAWHVRAMPGSRRRSRGVPAHVRRHSWMNHWLMILKNDSLAEIVRDLPWVLGWEIARLGHAVLRDPALLPAYAAVWTRVPGALRDRRFIQAARRTPPAAMRRWIGAGGRAATRGSGTTP